MDICLFKMADSVPVSNVPQTVTDHVVEPQPAELTTTVRFSDTCKDSSDTQPPSSRRDSGIEQSRLQHRTSGTSLPGIDTDRSKQLQVVPERWQTLSNKSKSSRSRSKSSGSVLEELVIATVFGGDQSSKLRRSSDRRAWSIATDADLRAMRDASSQHHSGMSSKRKGHVDRFTKEEKQKLLGKFRLAAKLMILCHRWNREYSFDGNKTYADLFPYIRTLHFHEYEDQETDDKIMIFNPKKYKANRQLRIPEETRRILSKNPKDRTEAELNLAQTALRNIKSYAEYPIRMQTKIVEVGTYERYESKRLILRQRHPAVSFYFILSGSVVVLIEEGEFNVSTPIAYLHKGMTFGELAIIHKTTRQSSVIAKETLELLSVNIDDFHNIFMLGGTKTITDPDHIQFLRSLECLSGWPLEKMTNECVFHYYRRGEILVKDSCYSDWLVIVKSGFIRVLKKLKRVDPRQQQIKQTERMRIEFKSQKKLREEREALERHRRQVLSEIRIPLRRSSNVDAQAPRGEVKTLKLPPISNVFSIHKSSPKNLENILADSNQKEPMEDDDVNTVLTGKVEQRIEKETDHMAGETSPNADPYDRDAKQEYGHAKSKQKKKRRKPKVRSGEDEEVAQEMKGREQKIRTIADDLDASYRIKDPDDLTEADLNPEFIHVQTLGKGEVFGLANLIHFDQPSFSVVSDGAECILLNKELYRRHASVELINKVKYNCPPYPSDEELQDKLQNRVYWQEYKMNTFLNTWHHLQEMKKFIRGN